MGINFVFVSFYRWFIYNCQFFFFLFELILNMIQLLQDRNCALPASTLVLKLISIPSHKGDQVYEVRFNHNNAYYERIALNI